MRSFICWVSFKLKFPFHCYKHRERFGGTAYVEYPETKRYKPSSEWMPAGFGCHKCLEEIMVERFLRREELIDQRRKKVDDQDDAARKWMCAW